HLPAHQPRLAGSPGRRLTPRHPRRIEMRRLFLLLFSLCLALPAAAERKYSFDDVDVHYSAFNSSFLQPEIAAAAGLTRSGRQGVLNIAVLKAGKPVVATVSGQVRNLAGQIANLTFRQVRERSEEHTSELQSRENLVCRLLLEKKKNNNIDKTIPSKPTSYI